MLPYMSSSGNENAPMENVRMPNREQKLSAMRKLGIMPEMNTANPWLARTNRSIVPTACHGLQLRGKCR